MKDYLKIFGLWLAAEIRTLFIDLTFSFSGNSIVGLLCCICTVGILLGLMARIRLVPDAFYRIYKLLCAPFLSVCNLLSADVSADSIPSWGMAILLLSGTVHDGVHFLSDDLCGKCVDAGMYA